MYTYNYKVYFNTGCEFSIAVYTARPDKYRLIDSSFNNSQVRLSDYVLFIHRNDRPLALFVYYSSTYTSIKAWLLR